MILEGIVTTVGPTGDVNVSPMGPLVDEGALERFALRPFQTSQTFRNLRRTGQGVFHVTDDVLLLAKAAVNRLHPLPELVPAPSVEGWILADACRWYAFRVERLDDSQPRTEIQCRVVESGRRRDFFGFNRAKHAVLEAAILATRLHLIPPDEIKAEFERLAVVVAKTAGKQESEAFDFLRQHVLDSPEFRRPRSTCDR